MSKYLAILLFGILFVSSLLMVMPAKAQVENVTTSCYIIANNIVEGQPVKVTILVSPAPPADEVFNNITVWLSSPMQGVWGNGGNGPWSQNNILTDTDGNANVTFDITTFSGYWNVGVYFLGQYFDNNTLYYQPSNWQTGFTVSPANTPTPLPTTAVTPSPTPTVTYIPTPTLTSSLIPIDDSSFNSIMVIVPVSVLVILVVSLLLYVSHLKRSNSKN